ncbi:glycoside hydrolase family 3 C-terminal domain-containing protein [Winogradskyella sp.]|nr:glycoside hydrolase family 3 C-terminal domain-containing protein [Winogradskyella sp.]MDB9755197.1 glycoside hydrolase family 3 C-terminal domain-containing protein [Winogradskyella sp.]MDB9782535.1 glycoside hydrolase family 3 C-terminal domain-containing protein [Winogradskyella sp.]MDC1230058.1 glycoside hydrolase family 3 C-terminal domain-containing protein [bacterium]MDC1505141.1 glycoside hydrolase family 3 C-terminal domain-containing protein [Winogradskyella sp.]
MIRNVFKYLSLIIVSAALLVSCSEIKSNTKSASGGRLYQDASASVEDRIDDLMSRMTLEDKAAQMSQYVGLEHMKQALGDLTEEELDKNDAKGFYPGFKTTDIAQLTREGKIGSFLHVLTAKEANELQKLAQESPLQIPLLIGIDAIHGNAYYEGGATVYPTPITQAATFDDALMVKASVQTAKEMRATGTQWTFTPNIDVLRDPRWGRTGETFGEDPFLVGNMGIASIKGLQGDDFSGYDKVITCAKHLIAGSQSINGLNASPTDVSKRTLFEIFLPPYKRAVQEANVYSIMAAHNEVNGMPGHMDEYMMTDLMRDRWGFDGFYVSDWNDISRIAKWHHVAKDFKESVEFSVNAGMDMNMHGPFFQDYVVELVNEGKIEASRVDDAVRKILEAKFRLGLFENPFIDLESVKTKIFTKEHQATALEQARKGIVLQKNAGLLPLKNLKGKKLFITGPNAHNMTTLGDWTSPQPKENYITIKEGLDNLADKYGYFTEYYDCGQRSKWITDENIATAKRKALNADILVLVLGENSYRHDWKNKTTGENIDRATLGLSGNQMKLANKIFELNKPVIVVYVSGSPVAEPWLEQRAKAVVNAWEPGAFGGQAVAEILMGEVNPSGKLPLTIPRSVGQLQMVYNHKPTAYIHKYNTEKKVPLHPFGFGLSYSKFEFSEPTVSKAEFAGLDDSITVTVDVKNNSDVDGEEVVQMYIRDNRSSYTRPVKELKGYKRVFVKAGETKTVEIPISAESLAMYDKDFNFVVEPGEFTIMTGNSSENKALKEAIISVSKLITLDKVK